MTGPERPVEGLEAAQDETGADETGADETGAEGVAPWRAPRWLVLAVAVLLVAALLVVRALLDDGEGEDAGSDRDLPAPALVTGAATTAHEVLTTWSRPGLDYDTWWAALRPMLTPRAREGYAHTAPRRVPALTVTGDPEVTAGPTEDTVTVDLPTDGGTFGVALYRSGASQRWRAVQILFPGQEGPFR